MRKDYTRELINKLVMFPCKVKVYSNRIHNSYETTFTNYEDMKRQCISQDLVFNAWDFLNEDDLKLSFKNCFHVWTSQGKLEASY